LDLNIPPREDLSEMLLVCGEALFDVFIPDSSGGAVCLDARPGGSPYNVAIGLARLGRDVGFLGAVSTDVLGQRLADYLIGEAVSDKYLVRNDNLTTLGMVGLAPDGSARYTFYNENAADRQLQPANLPLLGDEVRALHIGSFSMVAEPIGTTLEALVARESGRRLISYDPNVRSRIVPNPQVWLDKLDRLSHHIHVLKMSDEDFFWLYPDASAADQAKCWLSRGVRLVVMTEGRKGAVAWFGSEEISIPGADVAVVDTVGAGDTFQAALLCGLDEAGLVAPSALGGLSGDFVRNLMCFAARAAAITCSRRGADMPRRNELA
jgi:fructokinase